MGGAGGQWGNGVRGSALRARHPRHRMRPLQRQARARPRHGQRPRPQPDPPALLVLLSNLTIYPGSSRIGPRSRRRISDPTFTETDIRADQAGPFVTAVAARTPDPLQSVLGTGITGRPVRSTATNTDYFVTQSLKIKASRPFFDDREAKFSGAASCLIGKDGT